ncbi:MAG: Rrf2 family transcriptional regulator [bacterium]|nr:Rrf2 family transcriptional regulator [bacterium]
MLNISKTCQYGLRGLIFLIAHEERMPVKIAKIAEDEDIPLDYLRKIFQQLIKAGIVVSHKGPKGGVSLAPGSKKVHILEIVEIIDGLLKIDTCPILGVKNCPKIHSCPLKEDCSSLNGSIYHFLNKYTLENFVGYRMNTSYDDM